MKLNHAQSDMISRVVDAGTTNFIELCRLAGLNPARAFRFSNLAGVDFADCDLSGFDFTGANLTGADFRYARYNKAIFTDSILTDVKWAQGDPISRDQLVILISYSRKDERESPSTGEERWLSFVDSFLRSAIPGARVELLGDELASSHIHWEKEIEQKLRACDVLMLLVSPNSMASWKILDNEVAIIRERQADGEPVYFYPLLVTPTPAAELERIRDPRIHGVKPLSSFAPHDRALRMTDAADEIAEIGNSIAKQKRVGRLAIEQSRREAAVRREVAALQRAVADSVAKQKSSVRLKYMQTATALLLILGIGVLSDLQMRKRPGDGYDVVDGQSSHYYYRDYYPAPLDRWRYSAYYSASSDRWRFARRRFDQEAFFSPDGGRILTVPFDGTARLWDSDGMPIAVLAGHVGAVFRGRLGADLHAVFSPDGRHILTVSDDGTPSDHAARLWDSDGKLIATLGGHTGRIVNAAFSADGTRSLTVSYDDGTARLWDNDGKPIAVLRGHVGTVFRGHPGMRAEFSPDGRHILTNSYDTVRLWDADGKPLAILQGRTEPVETMVFSPNSSRILTESYGTVRLWDSDGRPLATLQGRIDPIVRTVFSRDSSRILTESHVTARLWDRDGKSIATVHTGPIERAMFSPDGRRILIASLDGLARLLDGDGKLIAVIQTGARVPVAWNSYVARTPAVSSVVRATFSPDSSRILINSYDASRLWDSDGKPIASLQGRSARLLISGVFSPDGTRILTLSEEIAQVWGDDGELITTLQGSTGSFMSGVFSPDGRRILTTSDDGMARLWDGDGRLIATFRGPPPRRYSYE